MCCYEQKVKYILFHVLWETKMDHWAPSRSDTCFDRVIWIKGTVFWDFSIKNCSSYLCNWDESLFFLVRQRRSSKRRLHDARTRRRRRKRRWSKSLFRCFHHWDFSLYSDSCSCTFLRRVRSQIRQNKSNQQERRITLDIRSPLDTGVGANFFLVELSSSPTILKAVARSLTFSPSL